MSSINYSFLIIQTTFGLAVTVIGIITGFIVLKKDSKFALNRLFSSGLFFMGLSMLFFSAGNIPYILIGEQSINTTITIVTMQMFLTFLVFSFLCFLYSGFILLYGVDQAFTFNKKLLLILFLILSLPVIWLTNSVIPIGLQGNIETGYYVDIIFYPIIVCVYIFTMYCFYKVFTNAGLDIKPQMRLFLSGWLIAGLSLLSSALSNYITYDRILDLISPLILCLSMIIIFQGFRVRNSEPKKEQIAIN